MLSAALYARVRLTTLLHTRPPVQRAPGIPCALLLREVRNPVKPRALRAAGSRSRVRATTTSLRGAKRRSNPCSRMRHYGLLRFARNDEILIRNSSQQTAPASDWRLRLMSELDVN